MFETRPGKIQLAKSNLRPGGVPAKPPALKRKQPFLPPTWIYIKHNRASRHAILELQPRSPHQIFYFHWRGIIIIIIINTRSEPALLLNTEGQRRGTNTPKHEAPFSCILISAAGN